MGGDGSGARVRRHVHAVHLPDLSVFGIEEAAVDAAAHVIGTLSRSAPTVGRHDHRSSSH